MNPSKSSFFLFFISLALFSCQNTVESENPTTEVSPVNLPASNALVTSLEKAHGITTVQSQAVVSWDLKLTFGGKERFNGTIWSTPNSSKIKMQRKSDDTQIVYDNEKFFQYPDTASWRGARFAIFTWQYFFMAPYKFSDEGTKWELLEDKIIGGMPYNTSKLTFTDGTGDAPDDWYIIYQNKKSDLLDGMAYIVTASGKTQEEAEKDAHAIYYSDYQNLSNGVPIASTWGFFNWNQEEGFNGEPIGAASVSNVKFYKEEGDIFDLPAGKKEIMD